MSILNLLNKKPCLLSEFEKKMKMNQPSISHHIRKLKSIN
ncbi:MAG: ArsR family transcriptional regulator [Promethearchaeota archaeon]